MPVSIDKLTKIGITSADKKRETPPPISRKRRFTGLSFSHYLFLKRERLLRDQLNRDEVPIKQIKGADKAND